MKTKRIGKFTITGQESHLDRFLERYNDEYELESLLNKIEDKRLANGEPTGSSDTEIYDTKLSHKWQIHQSRWGSRTWEIKQIG